MTHSTASIPGWSLASHRAGDRVVVAVSGELDMRTAPQLREMLTHLVTSGEHHVVVDLENVTILDSTGLGVLCGALNRVRLRGGTMNLVTCRPHVVRVFEETGLARVFPIHATLEAALAGEPDA